MARRRRRWGLRFGLLAVIALILGWQGWGLLQREGEGEPDGGSQTAAASEARVPTDEVERRKDAEVEADVPPDAMGDGAVGRVPPGDAGAADTGTGDARTGEAGSGEPEPAPVSAEVADRLFALQELIREAVATDRLGDGFQALEDLEEITRAGGSPALRAEGRQVLGNALTATVLQLREGVTRGSVLEARRLLRALRGTPHPRVQQALEMMASGEGWPPLGQAPGAAGEVPEPEPLVGERRVRVRWEDQIVLGRVAECRADSVTIRLQREDGVVFPTVGRVFVEPASATGEEAVQQGFAALRAGDRDLAWLWLCRAHAAGGAGDLVRQLGRLIGG